MTVNKTKSVGKKSDRSDVNRSMSNSFKGGIRERLIKKLPKEVQSTSTSTTPVNSKGAVTRKKSVTKSSSSKSNMGKKNTSSKKDASQAKSSSNLNNSSFNDSLVEAIPPLLADSDFEANASFISSIKSNKKHLSVSKPVHSPLQVEDMDAMDLTLSDFQRHIEEEDHKQQQLVDLVDQSLGKETMTPMKAAYNKRENILRDLDKIEKMTFHSSPKTPHGFKFSLSEKLRQQTMKPTITEGLIQQFYEEQMREFDMKEVVPNTADISPPISTYRQVSSPSPSPFPSRSPRESRRSLQTF